MSIKSELVEAMYALPHINNLNIELTDTEDDLRLNTVLEYYKNLLLMICNEDFQTDRPTKMFAEFVTLTDAIEKVIMRRLSNTSFKLSDGFDDATEEFLSYIRQSVHDDEDEIGHALVDHETVKLAARTFCR